MVFKKAMPALPGSIPEPNPGLDIT